jgi:hypothetical protein
VMQQATIIIKKYFSKNIHISYFRKPHFLKDLIENNTSQRYLIDATQSAWSL